MLYVVERMLLTITDEIPVWANNWAITNYKVSLITIIDNCYYYLSYFTHTSTSNVNFNALLDHFKTQFFCKYYSSTFTCFFIWWFIFYHIIKQSYHLCKYNIHNINNVPFQATAYHFVLSWCFTTNRPDKFISQNC